ncbi:hypothetical protein [Solimonas soli]|uniref:hypothetical protein n=1 Tax=Solimonas soli TaxID=413479 RepID=UPI0004AD1AAF|nr:hypothetical protein [Solimonas soli]
MPEPSTTVTLHGVFMRVHGTGVLLSGASGVGKSEVALELLARGHQLVADDAVDFVLRRGHVVGRAPRLLRGFLEARSLGILNIARLYGAPSIAGRSRLDLVLRLEAPREVWDSGLERLGGRRSVARILGIELPEITIPIRLGHNLAVLVEAACRDLQLRLAGYRADDDLVQRQSREIRKQEQREQHENDTP